MSCNIQVSFAGQEVCVVSQTIDLLPLCQIMFGHHAEATDTLCGNKVSLERVGENYSIYSETREGDAPSKIIQSLGVAMFELRDRLQYLLSKNQKDFLVVHAGAAKYRNKTYVYPAASGSGKTTLSAWFIGQGATLLSDELVAISPDGMVCGYAQALNVKAGGEQPFYTALGKPEKGVRKIEQPNGNAFVAWQSKVERDSWHKLDYFLLPKYDRECGQSKIEDVSPAQLAAMLLENTINLRSFDRMGLGVVRGLVMVIEGNQASYRDIADLVW